MIRVLLFICWAIIFIIGVEKQDLYMILFSILGIEITEMRKECEQ